MNETKIITVVGATGKQGGGVARAIAAAPESGFRARALTRRVDSTEARALASLGIEVVHGDLDQPETLARAFEGAHGVFGVTNFWEHFSPERELQQATAIAEAAGRAGVAHVVWSTLEDTRRWIPLGDARMPTLMGRYKVPHFDAKGEADAAFTAVGVPTTFMLTSFFWDNFIGLGMGPRRGDDGELVLVLPMGDARLPGIAVEDIGRCAFGIFRGGSRWVGARIGVCGAQPTGVEMAAAMSEALGRQVRYQAVPPAVYRGFGFPGADDLGNMFQFKLEFNADFCGARSVELSRTLNPRLQDFPAWLAANASRIPIPS